MCELDRLLGGGERFTIFLGVRVEIYPPKAPVSLTGAKEGPQSSTNEECGYLKGYGGRKWPTDQLAETGLSTGVPCCRSGRRWPPLGRRCCAERMPKRSSGRKGLPNDDHRFPGPCL